MHKQAINHKQAIIGGGYLFTENACHTFVSASGRTIQKLTSEQSALLRKQFSADITFRRELKMINCTNSQKKHKTLENLSWTKIKKTVHNWITADKRKVGKSST